MVKCHCNDLSGIHSLSCVLVPYFHRYLSTEVGSLTRSSFCTHTQPIDACDICTCTTIGVGVGAQKRVNCAGLSLYELPENIPANTTELLLSRNSFASIDPQMFGDLACRPNLKLIDLSQNYIITLNAGSFGGLASLEVLSLRDNGLKVIDYATFIPIGGFVLRFPNAPIDTEASL